MYFSRKVLSYSRTITKHNRECYQQLGLPCDGFDWFDNGILAWKLQLVQERMILRAESACFKIATIVVEILTEFP